MRRWSALVKIKLKTERNYFRTFFVLWFLSRENEIHRGKKKAENASLFLFSLHKKHEKRRKDTEKKEKNSRETRLWIIFPSTQNERWMASSFNEQKFWECEARKHEAHAMWTRRETREDIQESRRDSLSSLASLEWPTYDGGSERNYELAASHFTSRWISD